MNSRRDTGAIGGDVGVFLGEVRGSMPSLLFEVDNEHLGHECDMTTPLNPWQMKGMRCENVQHFYQRRHGVEVQFPMLFQGTEEIFGMARIPRSYERR